MSPILRSLASSPALQRCNDIPATRFNHVRRVHELNLVQLHNTLHATPKDRLQHHGHKFHPAALTRELQKNQYAREIEFREVHGRVRDAKPSTLIPIFKKEKVPSQAVIGSVIAATALGTQVILAGKELASKRNLSAADMDCAFDL